MGGRVRTIIHRSHYCDVDHGVDHVGAWVLERIWPRALPAVYALPKYLTCKKMIFLIFFFFLAFLAFCKGSG